MEISLLEAVALISQHMPTKNSFAITSQVSIMQKDRKSTKGIHNKLDIHRIFKCIIASIHHFFCFGSFCS